MPRPTWRLLPITALVLLLHGLVIGAVYRALGSSLPEPPVPPPPVLALGRIEVLAAPAAGTPAPTQAPDHRPTPGSRSGVPSTAAHASARVPQPVQRPAPVVVQADRPVAPLAATSFAPWPPPPTQAADEARPAGTPAAGVDTGAVPGPAGPKRATAEPAPASGLGAAAVAPAVDAPLRMAELLEPLGNNYPPISRARGERGTVVLKVLIGADGRTLQAKVGRSSGYPRLDQAALARVRDARFRPTQRGDTAQDAWYEFPVRFDFDP